MIAEAQIQRQPELPDFLEREIEKAELKGSLLSLAGQALDRLPDDYFLKLKQQQAGDGNIINFVAPLVHAARYGNPEILNKAEKLVIENMRTFLAEKPESQAIGENKYQLQWVSNGEGQHLYSDCGPLEESLLEGILNITGQIPNFEVLRNLRNMSSYRKLQALRSSNDPYLKYRTFIEYSPTADITDPEVRKRGYEGNDTILIYQLGEDGKENIQQYWFPGSDIREYKELFESIGMKLDKENLTDLDVMDMSDGVDDWQLGAILGFIKQKQGVVAENKDKIVDYSHNIIPKQLSEEILNKLYYNANLIAENPEYTLNSEEIATNMERILELFKQLQFEFRLFIRDVAKIDTFKGKAKSALDQNQHITYHSFRNLSDFDRNDPLKQYLMDACGFGEQEKVDLKQLIRGAFSAGGRFSSMITSVFKDTDVWICTDCRHFHDIRTGFVDQCMNCGTPGICDDVASTH